MFYMYSDVTIVERACDNASKRILKPLTHRLQGSLVNDQSLSSLQRYGDQAISGRHKNMFASQGKHVLGIVFYAPFSIYDRYERDRKSM